MGFLDSVGLGYFWGKIKENFLSKEDSTPIKDITRYEYDKLSETEKNADVIYNITDEVSNDVSSTGDGVPIGTVISAVRYTPPTGYIPCDGAVINIADYKNLADMFTSEFGKVNAFGGDGVTTFSTPNLNTRFILGSSLSEHEETDRYRIGYADGVETVTLNINQIPSHKHAVLGLASSGGTLQYNPMGTMVGMYGGAPIAQNVPTANTGGGNAHTNMPPYMNLKYFIKY